MKTVEIYKLQNDESQKIIAICKLQENGKAICEGDSPFTENLSVEGIRNYSTDSNERLFPRDGLKFLDQLKFNFRSGYLMAAEVDN